VSFKFSPKDVTLLAFPDEAMKHMALDDLYFMDAFAAHLPMMAGTPDCGSF
jgi:hypothetical protein